MIRFVHINLKCAKMHKFFFVNICMEIFLLFALISSCGGVSDLRSGQSVFHVSGSIIDLQAKSFTQVDRITIMTSDGQRYDLNVNKDLGKFTPAHLKQHMTLGDLVQVSYIDDVGMKWLEDIRDLSP